MIHINTYRSCEGAGLEGVRIGLTRHVPWGIRKADYLALGYYDVCIRLLAPSRKLLEIYLKEEITSKQFVCRYRSEIKSSGGCAQRNP